MNSCKKLIKKIGRKFPGIYSKLLRKNYFLIYTVAFITMSIFAFCWIFVSDKTFIFNNDAWKQHYPALIYYGKYLRKIVKKLIFEGKLLFPDWEFNIGEGADIVSTLHYYVIGEPLNILSVFVPSKYTHYLYSFLMILRLYLSGLSFSFLCFGLNIKRRAAVFVGSISYAFCYFALLNVTNHPFFVTPMIYLPVMILGAELILKGKKPYIFILSVAFAGLSNFYFFYMLVILTAVYCIVRSIILYKKDVKKIISAFFKILVPALIGVMMSGIVLIPVLMVFLSDSRMGAENPWHLLYHIIYYSKLPAILITPSDLYWLCLGISIPAVLTTFLFLRDKNKSKLLKVLFIICVIFALVPIFGQVLNGFSYRCNRWCFAFSLLFCFLLVKYWDSLLSLTKREVGFLFLCTAGYFTLCMFLEYSRTMQSFANVCLMGLTLGFAAYPFGKRLLKYNSLILVCLTAVSILCNSFWLYSSSGYNRTANLIDISDAENISENESRVIEKVSGTKNARFTSNNITLNRSLLSDVSGTDFYWSMSNPYSVTFDNLLGVKRMITYIRNGYDSRASLLSLASVKYYVSKNKGTAPYGFYFKKDVDLKEEKNVQNVGLLEKELGQKPNDIQLNKIKESNRYYVYENNYALPLGYCYDSYVEEKNVSTVVMAKRQQLMLSSVILSGKSKACPEASVETDEEELPFTVRCGNSEINYKKSSIVTTSKNTKLTLQYDCKGNSEIYFQICGLKFQSTDIYDLYFGNEKVDPLNLYNQTGWNLLSENAKKSIKRNHFFFIPDSRIPISAKTESGSGSFTYFTEEENSYCNKEDFVLNLGYRSEDSHTMVLSFNNIGVYSFDSIKIIRIPMENYSEKIEKLKKDSLKNINISTDEVIGSISLDKPKILVMSIAFSDGWKGYIDGKQVPVMTANDQYIAIDVPAGNHNIRFHYNMPFKYSGAVVTVLGFLLFGLAVCRYDKVKIKKLLRRGER